VYLKNIFIILVSSFFFNCSLNAQPQYGWRGSDRSGIYRETGLFKVWPAGGPELLWEASGFGTGYSSVTVTPETVYITGRKGDFDFLTAYTNDGKKEWEVKYGKSSDSNYPDTRCTPTFYKERLFLVSGMGDLVCISKDGKILWSVNYFAKYKAVAPRFGISESPLVTGNIVVVTPGGNMAAMVAFDIEKGHVVWESASINDVTHYVNPLYVEYGGKKMIITLTDDFIYSVDANNGKIIWKFNYANENSNPDLRKNHTNTPVFRDGYLFVASGYDHISVKLKLSPDGSAPVVVWKNTDIDPHVGGIVLSGDQLFSSNWESNSFGKWVSVDWNTGRTLWITDWHNKGSIISADGMLYIFEEKSGKLGLVKPGRDKLDVVGEFEVKKGTGPYWSHPVIDNGRLFVRHGDYFGVYAIR